MGFPLQAKRLKALPNSLTDYLHLLFKKNPSVFKNLRINLSKQTKLSNFCHFQMHRSPLPERSPLSAPGSSPVSPLVTSKRDERPSSVNTNARSVSLLPIIPLVGQFFVNNTNAR